ncbi:hypothetical protein POV27_18385 [Aureisphaera galaxeae]|uniref:hypothetical protein n=1 Tax=Aureisphaera galaxeae TaxID=1538023 RepID=UPI00235074BD|nr:hypothetical protein [Aureisphaera galaxeae]MDC8006026.1 hypothetical protein [Aureisphaera galaxeae]
MENATVKKPKTIVKSIKEQDIADSIANCLEGNNYWITADRIAECLEVSVQEVEQIAVQSNKVLINGQGQLTTRQLYKERTPFIGRLMDIFKNRID